MDFAFTPYPLSDEFRTRFEARVDAKPSYMTLQQCREIPLRRLAAMLRQMQGEHCFIAMESPGSSSLLPVFHCLAGLTSAKKIQLVHPDLRVERVSRFATIASLASVLTASIAGQRSMRRCRREMSQLLASPPIKVTPPAAGPVLYLKSNLWVGVRAGGSVGHVAGVVNALLKKGYPIDFAGTEWPLTADERIQFLPWKMPQNYGLPYESNLYRFHESMVAQGRVFCQRRKYVFLYQRLSLANYAGPILSREARLPLVIEYNGSEIWVAKNWSTPPRYLDIALQAEEVCLRHAHAVVTVSEVLRDELISRGVPPHCIVCYPNCIDPQVFAPDRFSGEQTAALRKRLGIPLDAVVATFIGTFGNWHGVELLAEAIRRFVFEHEPWLQSRRLHFLIVGDGPKMPVVQALLADSRCRPFFTLPGLVPQADAPLYLAASDILLSPHVHNPDGSRFFGSPTKLFEYMAMRKPIVASDLEQIGQILCNSLHAEQLPDAPPGPDERRLAVLSQPGAVDPLLAAIRFLVERPAWRGVLAANAARHVLSHYTWNQHVGAILDHLSSI